MTTFYKFLAECQQYIYIYIFFRGFVQFLCSYSTLPLYAIVTQVSWIGRFILKNQLVVYSMHVL